MRTLAALVFIAVCGAVAVMLFLRPTVVDGRVMAADLLQRFEARGITAVECDPQIPIGAAGAVFQCTVGASDGSTARIEYTMDRAGALSGAIVEGTGPAGGRAPASTDPWAN